MFNILPDIHQTLCYILDDKSKNNLEKSDRGHQNHHISASFAEGNNKKGRKYKKENLQMQTIENLDFPEMNVTFLKITLAKYIKDFEGKSCLFVKNSKKIQANSCKLSPKRTRNCIISLHNINRINNMLLDFMNKL